MLKNRKELMDCAQSMYEALLSRAAQRYFDNAVYTLVDRVGVECTRLEELFRPMWGLAPILNERELNITVDGKKMAVSDFYQHLMLEGTDSSSPNRFDRNVSNYDREFFANQSITEIAGYLTCVFFAREKLWDSMSRQQQDQIAAWVVKWAVYAVKHSWPNNHYWYPIICIEILKHLGYDLSEADAEMQTGFEVLDSLYIDHGWYSDGEFGRFDYYEAWAHHCYTLLYILIGDRSRPDYLERCRRYRERSEEFLRFFAHYFDVDGAMAAYGRSICYRFAAVSAYGLAAAVGCKIDYGLARRLILRNISYFFDNSIMPADGVLPDGDLYDAFCFVENYTSEGSNCCYTEGFMGLLCGEDSPLWTAQETPMPIEQRKYLIACPQKDIGIVLCGNAEKNGVTLFNNSVHYYQEPFFTKRFNDMAAYYGKFAYNSRSGYSIGSRDQVSSENMISLYTPDGRMASHRQQIHTVYTRPEHMVSWHTPFSNDPDTVITTHLLPLDDGYHVRVHKVTLSQPYLVCEGGFSVGVLDDDFSAEAGVVRCRGQYSSIAVTASVPCTLCSEASHPGMHLLKPRAIYPCYQSGILERGTYIFAAAVYYSTDGRQEEPAPQIAINENTVTICYRDTRSVIELGEGTL